MLDGSVYTMAFQVAGVSKALGAVSRIVGAGNRVVFDDPNTVGSFIENTLTGKETPLRQHNGAYYMDVWVKPGHGLDNQDFSSAGKLDNRKPYCQSPIRPIICPNIRGRIREGEESRGTNSDERKRSRSPRRENAETHTEENSSEEEDDFNPTLAAMESEEIKFLSKIGISDPYK